MAESIQDYSWIQDFEADLKFLIRQIIASSQIYFQYVLRQLSIYNGNCYYFEDILYV